MPTAFQVAASQRRATAGAPAWCSRARGTTENPCTPCPSGCAPPNENLKIQNKVCKKKRVRKHIQVQICRKILFLTIVAKPAESLDIHARLAGQVAFSFGRVFVTDTRALLQLLYTRIRLVIVKQHLVQIARMDGPTEGIIDTRSGCDPHDENFSANQYKEFLLSVVIPASRHPLDHREPSYTLPARKPCTEVPRSEPLHARPLTPPPFARRAYEGS